MRQDVVDVLTTICDLGRELYDLQNSSHTSALFFIHRELDVDLLSTHVVNVDHTFFRTKDDPIWSSEVPNVCDFVLTFLIQ